MRILLPAALAALLLAMPHRAPAQTPPAASPQPADTAADPVIAIVDGTAIRRSEMLAMQRQLPAQYQQMPIEMIFPVLLERMIDSKLIAVAGRQVGLQNEPEVKARVASFEERVVQEVYLTRRIAQRADDATLRKRYDEFVKANPPKEEIHARHILVATESEANTVSDALRKGADFQKLAGEKTIDPSGKTTGGDLGEHEVVATLVAHPGAAGGEAHARDRGHVGEARRRERRDRVGRHLRVRTVRAPCAGCRRG